MLVYSAASRQIESIDSVRPGTRAELYRRIQRAYICIQDAYNEELCLEKIARVACMSPHHFHRVFSQVYGITPLRALADRRMQMAHKLLRPRTHRSPPSAAPSDITALPHSPTCSAPSSACRPRYCSSAAVAYECSNNSRFPPFAGRNAGTFLSLKFRNKLYPLRPVF